MNTFNTNIHNAGELNTQWMAGLDFRPALPVTSLLLDALQLAPNVFQYRMDRYSGKFSEEHIRSLVRSLKTHKAPLPPLTVFYIDAQYYIVDGHHRYEAYNRCKHEVPEVTCNIPVVEFRGSFQDALLEACQANARDKLNMCVSEKRNATWRLLLACDRKYGDYKAISQATGISKNTVTKYANLQDEIRDSGEDPATYTVYEALNRQKEVTEYNEDWQDAQASHMASKLRREAGPMLRSHPEITAKAFLEVLGEEIAKAVVLKIAYTLNLPVRDPDLDDYPF